MTLWHKSWSISNCTDHIGIPFLGCTEGILDLLRSFVKIVTIDTKHSKIPLKVH